MLLLAWLYNRSCKTEIKLDISTLCVFPAFSRQEEIVANFETKVIEDIISYKNDIMFVDLAQKFGQHDYSKDEKFEQFSRFFRILTFFSDFFLRSEF